MWRAGRCRTPLTRKITVLETAPTRAFADRRTLLVTTLVAAGLLTGIPALAQQSGSARIAELERQIAQLGSGLCARSSASSGLPLHGFVDVGYNRSGEANPLATGTKGFGVGSFDLYLTPQFTDRVKALVELIFEVESDGGLLTDLERAQIGYTFSDAATVWAGRFHTPFGYWNTGFHHGAQIQTSILRPRFLDFEDKVGIFPNHMTGIWATGNIRAGEGRLAYDAYGGNGPRIEGNALNPQMGGDDNHSAMMGGNLSYDFGGALEGLRLGVHWLRGNVRDDLATPNATRIPFFGPHLIYNANDWEVMGEYYGIRNRDLSGGTGDHSSKAGYLQVARMFGPWTPFARAERATLDQNDKYFAQQNSGRSYDRGAIGLRYDLNATAALKVEATRTRLKQVQPGGSDDRFSGVHAQYSIRF